MRSTSSLPVSGHLEEPFFRIMYVMTKGFHEKLAPFIAIFYITDYLTIQIIILYYDIVFSQLMFQLNDYRAEFSRWWSKEMRAVKFPSQGTVFDYFVDSATKKFTPWNEKMVSNKYVAGAS